MSSMDSDSVIKMAFEKMSTENTELAKEILLWLSGYLESKEKEEKHSKFCAAMARLHSVIEPVPKNGKVEYSDRNGNLVSFDYALLSDIGHALSTPLANCGLSYRFEQSLDFTDHGPLLTVTCIITHESGHEERNSIRGPIDTSLSKSNYFQQTSSANTYLRRIALTSGFGLVVGEFDDDGGAIQDGEAQAPEQAVDNTDKNYYPDDIFKRNFPQWCRQMDSGKTAGEILEFLESKNIKLSDEQIDKVEDYQSKIQD